MQVVSKMNNEVAQVQVQLIFIFRSALGAPTAIFHEIECSIKSITIH